MTNAIPNTSDDDAAVDRWWAEPRKPRRPSLKIVEVSPYATTMTITCRACGMRATVDIAWPGLLCGMCRADLDATEANLQACIADVTEAGEEDTEAWLNYQAGLDDALADRWTTLVQSRDAVKARLDRALTGKKTRRDTPEAIQADIDATRAAWAEMQAKIERTAQNPANPLSGLLKGEAMYKAAMAEHTKKLQAFELGLAEIDVARGANDL